MLENALMGRFIPCEFQEAKIRELITLNTDCMSVHANSQQFVQLFRYAPKMVVEMRSKISLFVV